MTFNMVKRTTAWQASVIGSAALLLAASVHSFSPVALSLQQQYHFIGIDHQYQQRYHHRSSVLQASTDASETKVPAPVLDGQRVLPLKIMRAGLKEHQVAAVYALLNSDFKKGTEGWEHVEYVGVSMDLDATLEDHASSLEAGKMAHVRALSFAIPSKPAMDDWAKKWRNLVSENGGGEVKAEDYLFDYDDDDDDDDDDDWDPEMLAASSAKASELGANGDIVSPFDPNAKDGKKASTTGASEMLELTAENVDEVLNEVRPYLIADGGNVAVEGVDTEKGQVLLKMEGACGSCSSSTITMSMGIERVLKENFGTNFKEVVEVQDPEQMGPSELVLEDVQEEFDRLYPAIVAMGGVSKILSVDPELGVVNMVFRGSNKVRQGLELAILDLPFVNRVEFSMDD